MFDWLWKTHARGKKDLDTSQYEVSLLLIMSYFREV